MTAGPHRALLSPRIVAASILAFGGMAIYAVNFPGSMEYDSFVQLLEARNESYGMWHPPVMSWMLGVSDSLIGPPAAWFVLFDMTLAFGALTALLWLLRRVRWPAAACAAAILFLPQLLLDQAVVWKDGLFADACLAGFVCLGFAGEHWRSVRVRLVLLGTSAALLALAALTRQNGLVMVPCAALGLALIAARRERHWRPAAAYAAGFVAVTALLGFAAETALELRSDGTPAREEQVKLLQLYDITGMVKRKPSIGLAVLAREAPPLKRVILDEGVRRWTPVKTDTLEMSPRIVAALDAAPASALWHQWSTLVATYPGTYLAVRAELFLWVFQAPDVLLCHPYHVGDEGDPADLAALGMQPRMDRRDYVLWHYARAFDGTPAYSHVFFATIAAGVLFLLLRRRRPADVALASLIAATFLFTATFFVISIACDYRYLYVIDLSALAGAVYVAADWPRKRKGGPKAPLGVPR